MATDTGQGVSKGGARKQGTNGPRKAGPGSQIVIRGTGLLILLFGLLLIGMGYSDVKDLAGATPGQITIKQCHDTGKRRAVIIECTGTFVSDDGKHRYRVDDYGPDEEYDKGETVDVLAQSSSSFQPAAAVQYATAAKAYSIGTALFSLGLLMLVIGANRRGNSPSAARTTRQSAARWFIITCLSVFGLGMVSVGVCALLESVLA